VTEIQDLSGKETKVVAWGYDIESKKENQFVFTTKESLTNPSEGRQYVLEDSECINVCVESASPFIKATAWYPCADPCDIPEEIKVSSSKLKGLKNAYILGATKNKNDLSVEFVYCGDLRPLSDKIQKIVAKSEMVVQDSNVYGLEAAELRQFPSNLQSYKGCAQIKVADGKLEFARKTDCFCGQEIEQELRSARRKEILKESADLKISWSETGTETINVQMYPWGLIEKEVVFKNSGKIEMKIFCYVGINDADRKMHLISTGSRYASRGYGSPPGEFENYLGIKNASKGKYDYLQCIHLKPSQTKTLYFPITSLQNNHKSLHCTKLEYSLFLTKIDEPFDFYREENEDFLLAQKLVANIELLGKTAKTEIVLESDESLAKPNVAVYQSSFGLSNLLKTRSRIIISAYTGRPEECIIYYNYTCLDASNGRKLWTVNTGKKIKGSPCCFMLSISKDTRFIVHNGFNTLNYRINIESGNLESIEVLENLALIEESKFKERQTRINELLSVINIWKPDKKMAFHSEMANYILDYGSIGDKIGGSDFTLLENKVLFFVNNCLLSNPGFQEHSVTQSYSTVLCFDRKTGSKLYEINYELFDSSDEFVLDKYLVLNTDLFDINTGEYIGKFNSFMTNENGIEEPWHRKTIGNGMILLYAFSSEGEKTVLKMKMVRIKN
jgi:hypothetical protein